MPTKRNPKAGKDALSAPSVAPSTTDQDDAAAQVVRDLVHGLAPLFPENPAKSDLPDTYAISEEQRWLAAHGWTPAEFLAHVYRHPLIQIRDRIAAAKALVAIAHKEQPKTVQNPDGSNVAGVVALSTGNVDLGALSDAEVTALGLLLAKARRA